MTNLSNLVATYSYNLPTNSNRRTGQFRAANNAADIYARKPTSSYKPDEPVAWCNPKFVYDSSDYVRFLKNKNSFRK
tara:strand:+ start:132 stop:362 length:231 start_codon:yes stop_codon:yes gene_type:complete